MMDQLAFFRDYISTWEGGLSLDPTDTGNWYTAPGGKPVLVGSNRGVTANALAAWRGHPGVTKADIATITLEQAASIGASLYYHKPGLDALPWDQVAASVVDFGWGAGPNQAIMSLQRQLAVAPDGQLGPFSVRAYSEWVTSHGIEAAARQWAEVRNSFYELIVERRPVNAKYLNGWKRRTAYFLPESGWWTRFGTFKAKAA